MLMYRPPSLDALMCRRAFYTNSKVSTESTTEWFERVAKSVNGCEFENFADIMLIDKFLSGMDETVYQHILKEISLDSHQALQAALASETHSLKDDEKSDFFLKTEVQEENNSNWLDNDVDRWMSDNAELMKTESVFLPTTEYVLELGVDEVPPTGTQKSSRKLYKKQIDSSLPCPKCDKRFPNNAALIRHISYESGHSWDFECYICRTTFRELWGLRVHMGKMHPLNVVFSAECDVCYKKFNNKIRYDKHKRKHNGPRKHTKRHVCGYCGGNYSSACSLKRHQLHHTNAPQHTCEVCGKICVRKDRLEKHMQLHNREPYKCRFCPKIFSVSQNLRLHERVHTGEKPYKCDHPSCDKAFSHSASYARHKRVHARIKPCPCHLCDMKFATNYHLQRHMTVHTGQKAFCCDLCGNRFTQRESLTAHQATVHKLTTTKSD